MATDKETMEKLRQLINEGWGIYGNLMDVGEQDSPIGQALKATLSLLEKTKARLALSSQGNVHEYIDRTKEFLQ